MPARPRPKSMLSFTHRRSSSGSHPKVENLTETTEEKASHRVTSKADPTKAINELQPTDPDRSNPTRPRLERPLDTIRAFEAAIDGSYERRPPSRGGTFHKAIKNDRPQHKIGSETISGHYSNRLSTGRPDSYADNYVPNQPGYGRRIRQRVNSDPTLYGSNNHGLYPAHVYHQSYDTAASGSGNESHNTDPWGNSTDPSSENSSIDRIQVPKPDPAETYGFNGFGGAPHFQGPILEENGVNSPAYGQIGYGQAKKTVMGSPTHSRNGFHPAPPSHGTRDQAPPRAPIRLGNPPATERPMPSASGEKRKSWLKRRFSKS
ncbi:MAG: hypothetical protein Q9185_001823 [Variospora sp. 1 TL-2023]